MLDILKSRIKFLAVKRDMSLREISLKASNNPKGDNDSLLKNWFRKSAKTMPRIDSIQKVADVLNCDVEFLLGEQEEIRRSKFSLSKVPLVSWVSAGQLADVQTIDLDDIDELPSVYMADLDPSGDWIALRVDGRSMDKVSPHDSIIFVNRNDKTLVDRGLYVFLTSEGEATYKRFVYPDKLKALTTKPDQYGDIPYDPANPPEVIGRVRKSTIDL